MPFSVSLPIATTSLRALTLAALSALTVPALAAWSSNPAINNSVCTATLDQSNVRMVALQTSGTIMTWIDARGGGTALYAQLLNSSGVPLWQADGVIVCSNTPLGSRNTPQIASDGSGGAIIVWQDNRAGVPDIYIQRVDSSGVAQWTADGVALCAAANTQKLPQIISDGSGGAIVTWDDNRSGATEIYARRIDSTGTPLSTVDGVALTNVTGSQDAPQLVSDGAGGAIVTWSDHRNGTYDIYARRFDSSSVAQWTANGVALTAAVTTDNQDLPQIISDGSGGAIIAWRDDRSTTNFDIYVRRINSAGTPQWTADGVALCTDIGNQTSLQLVSDGSAGAIVTWTDTRNGNNDVYARRIDSTGTPQWTADGVALCTDANSQDAPQITTDGSAGAIVTWQDSRNATTDVYARRINSAGTPQWTANGVAVSTPAGNQTSPLLGSDGIGGAYVTWVDGRGASNDIYAANVSSSGVLLPVAISHLTIE